MTVRELEHRMEYREFCEWAEFYSQDPWGELRADRRTALLALQFHNAHRSRNSPPAKLDDFMLYEPFKQEETEEQAGQRLVAQALALRKRTQPKRTH